MPTINVPYAPSQIYVPNGRLVDLIRAQGQDAARTAELRGQQQAALWSGVGNAITSTVGQVIHAQQQAPIDQLNKLKADDAAHMAAGKATLASGMQAATAEPSGPMISPDEQSQQPDAAHGFLTKEGDVSVWDIPKLTSYLAQKGFGDNAETLLAGAQQMNTAHRQEAQAKIAYVNSQQQTFATSATQMLKLMKLGMPVGDAFDLAATPAVANGSAPPASLMRLKSQLVSMPIEQATQTLQNYADLKPKKIGFAPEGSQPVDELTGEHVGEAIPGKAPALNESELALRAAGGDPVLAMHFLKPGEQIKAGTQEDWVNRARRLALANNGGKPLTDAEQQKVDTAAIAQFHEINTDPEVRQAALAQKNLAQALTQMQLNQQPSPEDAKVLAQQIVDKKMAPSQMQLFGGFGSAGAAFKRMVGLEAIKIDPEFNWEEAQANYDLAKSTGFQNTIRYMDATVESLPRLEETAKRIGNGQFKSVNDLVNASKNQFNDADLKAFKTDALLVGDEVAKILQGGGSGSGTSDAKLKQASEIINTSDNVPAIASAIKEIQFLIGNRRSTLTRGTFLEKQKAAEPKTPTLTKPSGVTIQRGG